VHIAPGFAIGILQQRQRLQEFLYLWVAAQFLVTLAFGQDAIVLLFEGGDKVIAQFTGSAFGVDLLDTPCATPEGIDGGVLGNGFLAVNFLPCMSPCISRQPRPF